MSNTMTANVLIVAKTKMSGDKRCIGAIDLQTGESYRLMTASGNNHDLTTVYKIGDEWEIEYLKPATIRRPHTEDIYVSTQAYIQPHATSLDASITHLCRFKPFYHIGNLNSLFQGKLQRTNSGLYYIRALDSPDFSTCFCRITSRLVLCPSTYAGKRKDYFMIRNCQIINGDRIIYVGDASPRNKLNNGTLIRLSLARPWTDPNANNERRCYLQLSGAY